MPDKVRLYLFIFALFLPNILLSQSKQKFKVVLDAGHGGKDFGAIKNGLREKDVALDVVLKIGRILNDNEDIDILYSRKTDVFVELRERADKANKAKANLFVSVHCNSSTSSKPYGSLTLVMGLSRTSTNLEIAKTENSVIFQEANYKKNYKGFDPNKPETLIGLKILQEESLKSSIDFASTIQYKFGNKLNRKNKGVHQQPLWVLDATYMPGVLIELGFISNKSEAQYLGSEKGKKELAKAIAESIIKFKEDYFSVTDSANNAASNPATEEKDIAKEKKTGSKKTYKVQIATSKKKVDATASNFKGLKNISRKFENGYYKYFYGSADSNSECKKLLIEAKKKGYESAYIVADNDNK
ncbi:N-acetylmuramoyl-L-alanine amidase precursor [Flavobacterium saliperosum S13]|uniref:N-acetylmuramoyl-L-alanine amidase n=2 Tax=Flavobacterium saliperosum TaxID=329186 RepID=A0A1G4VJV8_9FLAO|nr:N-acetylmuramoyl-L-alanine amidase [Flavobacterium saliperosum]ESU25567.1 N-acetylmuramoyl-L-alanine amidase precursor [Flavobacterium saliperosum S13]SCX07883.1 N-acetylmuramoyl-L-alanine amidase [Flavobacterium saliperosum]